ncbi:MAG: hypothetical protein Q8L15_06930, partial [Methylobacter sp.]|nr:hypothetical protein [Methylobacter sp.]
MTEYKDSVKDRFTTTGTGTITVDGVAAAGCRTIASAHSTGATVSYRMENASQTEWEDGEGVWTASGSTLTRVSVLASSNSNALVNFSAGTKIVSTTLSAKSVLGSISARNTVQSGPINTDGSSNFGGSTGSTTVTASGTLIFTAAGGFGRGAIDWVSSITNPSWTGLSTNGTMYLFLDADTVGGATTASSTLPMIETRGATPATTSGQLTYNYVEHKSYLGNGSTAPQARRVPVGEVTVSGGVVAAGSIIWYALNRDYDSGLIATLPAASTAVSVNHYLGS